MTVLPTNVLNCMSRSDRMAIGKHCQTGKEIDRAMSFKLERELHRNIVNLLSIRDVWVGRSRFGKRTTFTPGAPDLIFKWNGRAYAFECKIGKEQPTKVQMETHMQMRRNGWLVFVVRSLEEAKSILDGEIQELI